MWGHVPWVYLQGMKGTNRATLALLGIIAVILVGWVLRVGASILQPIVIALLLASMLQPLVVMLAKKRVPPALTVVGLILVVGFLLAEVGILFQSNARAFLGLDSPAAIEAPGVELSEEQAEAIREAGDWGAIQNRISERLRDSDLPEPVSNYLANAIQEMELTALAEGLALSGYGFVKGLLLVLIYMVFIFSEQAVFRRKILAIAGDHQTAAAEILDTIGRGIQRYLGVKTVVSLLTGSLCYLVLVALQVPYALLFGFFTFLLNYIPTFGSIIAGIFPTITALAIDGSMGKAAVVVLTYVSVNLILGSFIEPRILGRELNLSPLVIVISVVIWTGLWGVVGGFLAVPLTAALQITLASNETTRPIAIMLGSGPPKSRSRPEPAGSQAA